LRYDAVISAIALCRGLLGIAYLNKKNTGVQENPEPEDYLSIKEIE
jgi:hypothetical protein